MLEFGEGLWYITTSGHKESQHFYNCASIYFMSKTNVRNRKENKNGEMLTWATCGLALAGPFLFWPSPPGAEPSSSSCQ